MTEGLERNEMKRNSQSWSFPKDRHGSFEIFFKFWFFSKKSFLFWRIIFFLKWTRMSKKAALIFQTLAGCSKKTNKKKVWARPRMVFQLCLYCPQAIQIFPSSCKTTEKEEEAKSNPKSNASCSCEILHNWLGSKHDRAWSWSVPSSNRIISHAGLNLSQFSQDSGAPLCSSIIYPKTVFK